MKLRLVNYDRVLGGVLLVLIAVLFAETFNFRTRPHVPLNTAFWPRVILGLLAAVALTLVIRGRIGNEDHEEFAREALTVFVSAAAFVVALSYFGFLLASGVLVAAGFVWLSEDRTARTWIAGALFGGLATASVYALFKFALKVQLPEGAMF